MQCREREGEKERREEWERQSVERGQRIEIHFELLLSDSDVIRNNSQTDNKCLRCGPCVSCLCADLNIRFDQIVYYTNIDIRNATERSSSSNSSKFHDAAFSLGEFRKFQSQSRSFTLSIFPYICTYQSISVPIFVSMCINIAAFLLPLSLCLV